jgi:hypothetical protein
MTFKASTWRPIAIVLSAANLVGVGLFAGDTWHAAAHAALALGFGLWAQRLGHGARGSESQIGNDALDVDRLDALEDEVSRLRQELSEAQERLDFTERMLAQGRETGRVGPRP